MASHPRTDPGRLERGPLAPERLSLSGPSLLPRHRSERRCFKCQTGHTCKACRLCLNTRPACLSVWCPYSVDPEAELRLIVWGQLTCREGRNKSKKRVAAWNVAESLKYTAESPRNIQYLSITTFLTVHVSFFCFFFL